MAAISDVHVRRAQGTIDDSAADAFDERVDALLRRPATYLESAASVLTVHTAVIDGVSAVIDELRSLGAFLQPNLNLLYSLHHYPPPPQGNPEPPEELDVLPEEPLNITSLRHAIVLVTPRVWHSVWRLGPFAEENTLKWFIEFTPFLMPEPSACCKRTGGRTETNS
jgi:hypothetical protein